MTNIRCATAVIAITLLTAMPYARADYNYRCDPLPAPIVVEKEGPLPDRLSPLARRHVDAIRSHVDRTEVIQIDAGHVVVLKHLFSKEPMIRIIVDLEGKEHSFYMRRMQPFLISGIGVVDEHKHVDIGFVGEYTLRLINSYRGGKALGTSIEVSLDYFGLASDDGRGCPR
jgi:hypothetical protein